MDVVKKGKETQPLERHSILLIWYYLKLKNEGVEASEEHFNLGEEVNYFPLIRFHYSMGLCEFIFSNDSDEEQKFFDEWEKAISM